MLSQMKSSHRHRPAKPCPCNDACPCHQPESWSVIICYTLAVIIFIFAACLGVYFGSHQSVQHIDVNGQDCIIKTINIDCMEPIGCKHKNIAVCP
jgi:hypothetical protein